MEPQERHALLIAVRFSPRIYEHPCFRIYGGYKKLSSDNDVDLMRDLLVGRFDFPEENVKVLKTLEASQEAILHAVEELIGRVGRDDVVVIYYSGHGSRMRHPTNPGGMCETIVPNDSSRAEGERWECEKKPGRPCKEVRSLPPVSLRAKRCGPRKGGAQGTENRDIPDVEIDRWVRQLNEKTSYVTLIFDCCHSGSATRDPIWIPREVVPDLRPAERMFQGAEVPPFFRGALEGERMRCGWLPLQGRSAVMVASCRASEVSWEGLNSGHGLLTQHLHAALRELGPQATWTDVLETVAPRVSGERESQHPELEGDIDLRVFGRDRFRPDSYLPVVAVEGEMVELWGGATLGISVGSLWTIRPQGTRSRHEGEELARVLVEHVRPATSRARREEGAAADGLEAGQRAFLLEENLPAPGLRVTSDAPDERCGPLVERLRTTPLLAIVEPQAEGIDGKPPGDEDGEIVTACCLAPRATVEPGDPFPFLGSLEEWTWAAVDTAGQLQARLRPDDDDGIRHLTQDLVKLARFRGLRRLANPDPESPLRGRVDFRIVDPADPGRDAGENDEDGDLSVIEAGEKVDFEIRNLYDEQVWVSLVELDSDHSVSVLMPARNLPYFELGGVPLAPGQVLQMGRGYYGLPDGFPQILPDGFPWSEAGGKSQGVGISYFKVMVTMVSAEFKFLEQEGTRFEPAHPLEAMAWLCHSSFGTRTVVLPPEDVAQDEHWTVVTRRLGIRKGGSDE